MDSTVPERSLPLEITALVAAVEGLPKDDKAAALQYLASRWQLDGTNLQTNNVEDEHGESCRVKVHSCHICKQFVISKRLRVEYAHSPGFDYNAQFTSGKVVLTKEDLQKGLRHGCLLVEKIYMLLAQDLRAFESDITKKVKAPEPTSRGTTDHLQFIGSRDVSARLYGYEPELTSMFLAIDYEPDPYLLDRLFEVSPEARSVNDYDTFKDRYKARVSTSLKVSAFPNDPAAVEVHTRATLQNRNTEDYIEIARNFLSKCQTQHDNCSRPTPRLPSRVIDVGTRFPIRWVKLHWSDDDETGNYAALSYCWGGEQPFTTTSKTIQDHTTGIQFSLLPQTLKDAMVITHKLGLRYIWIDSLCIIQDDPEDLNREIANMEKTFQGALVTISAANAATVHSGFLNKCQPILSEMVSLPYHSPNVSDGTILVYEKPGYDTMEDPINLRAWTLQEHILAHRMLIFGSKDVGWVCGDEVQFLDHEPARPQEDIQSIFSQMRHHRYSLDAWRLIVRDYSRRFLTYSADKLSAIAGVAKVYSESFGKEYLAGLWKYSLLSELMWCSVRGNISRPISQRAPSWSWAAVDGEVHHKWCTQDAGFGVATIVDCRVTPVSESSPFGPVISDRCVLVIQGLLINVSWQDDRMYIYPTKGRKHKERESSEGVDDDSQCRIGRTQADAADNHSPDSVWVLVMTRFPVRGLLLEHLRGQTYRRVGLVLRLWDESFIDFGTQPSTVSIV